MTEQISPDKESMKADSSFSGVLREIDEKGFYKDQSKSEPDWFRKTRAISGPVSSSVNIGQHVEIEIPGEAIQPNDELYLRFHYDTKAATTANPSLVEAHNLLEQQTALELTVNRGVYKSWSAPALWYEAMFFNESDSRTLSIQSLGNYGKASGSAGIIAASDQADLNNEDDMAIYLYVPGIHQALLNLPYSAYKNKVRIKVRQRPLNEIVRGTDGTAATALSLSNIELISMGATASPEIMNRREEQLSDRDWETISFNGRCRTLIRTLFL